MIHEEFKNNNEYKHHDCTHLSTEFTRGISLLKLSPPFEKCRD